MNAKWKYKFSEVFMYNFSNVTTIYVSQKSGNDKYTGFFKEDNGDFQGPVKTLERALEKAAQMRSFGALQPLNIVIIDDVYYVDKTIYIDEKISSIKITSNNKTIISGGMKIENFSNDIYNGQKCFSADVHEIENGLWFTDLYVDNKRADFTHYPKTGKLEIETAEDNSENSHASSKWFIAKKEDIEVIKNFKNFNDCFISYNHFWIDEHTPIESYDLDSGKIVFKYKSRFSISKVYSYGEMKYILENVSECFLNKNEWYLDRETKKVYYIPRSDLQTEENISVFAPLCDKLFVIKGKPNEKVKNIRFENLIFECTKGDYKSTNKLNAENGHEEEDYEGFASDSQSVSNAPGTIEFYNARNCEMKNCVMRNIGVHAVTVNEGCSRIIVENNDMYDLGGGAIKVKGGIYGCDKAEETYGNIIRNNIITDSGNRYFSACGILLMHTYDNVVSNNEISYQYYTGISVGWVWGYGNNITHDNIVENNHIHHIGQGKLSDMGGIYLLGRQPGTVVRNNVIHDVISAHYGAIGIYTDEGSSEMTFENNICYNINGQAYQQHYGHQNTVRNNIFAKCSEPPVSLSREELHTGVLLEKNIIVTDNTAVYRFGGADNPVGSVHLLSSSDNLIFDEKEKDCVLEINEKKYTLKEAKEKFHIEIGSEFSNPQFKDFENNDFTLNENSPALKLGFKNIDISNVGAKR